MCNLPGCGGGEETVVNVGELNKRLAEVSFWESAPVEILTDKTYCNKLFEEIREQLKDSEE